MPRSYRLLVSYFYKYGISGYSIIETAKKYYKKIYENLMRLFLFKVVLALKF